ncbi:hypothetical protein jhhlp_001017 [Lomentospora prolificans]|uniref:U6 snRNA phosphodiesterase n=1 Tax=Lomentospora prolificans TaxID=41688 RepID=A0A2N3NK29_9PEZI|nr:hypothetical protein jhhlp_001017 [Lomentospora prolificans]
MGLVDYSDSDSDSPPPQPDPKRRKSSTISAPSSGDLRKGSLPPLPDNFHDLYASTVRQSVADDPSLHQGRKRLNPHKVGNWPSHVYIEWHPSDEEHRVLVALIEGVQKKLRKTATITSLLSSDLGAPLPLHISLSRPLALTTAQKDDFLESISTAIHASSIPPHFFKSPDSNRTFLVLNVRPCSRQQDPSHPSSPSSRAHGKPLTALLKRCNSIAESFNLPQLYQKGGDSTPDENAFHISLAWTLDDVPDGEEVSEPNDVEPKTPLDEIKRWAVRVSGVKVKIGNVVTHVGLEKNGASGKDEIFGW